MKTLLVAMVAATCIAVCWAVSAEIRAYRATKQAAAWQQRYTSESAKTQSIDPSPSHPSTTVWTPMTTPPQRPPDFGTSSQYWDTGDGLFRSSREWGDTQYMGWEDRLVASCPRFVTCAAFLKRKYNVSHEDIQFIARTLYSGLSGGEEPQESNGLVNVERESAFDLMQMQTVSLSGKSAFHTKMFAPEKAARAGRTAVITAYVACPVRLGQTMQAGIDAAIQRTFHSPFNSVLSEERDGK
jgi:hypothetical protein